MLYTKQSVTAWAGHSQPPVLLCVNLEPPSLRGFEELCGTCGCEEPAFFQVFARLGGEVLLDHHLRATHAACRARFSRGSWLPLATVVPAPNIPQWPHTPPLPAV